MHAELRAGFHLRCDVNVGGWVIAHDHHGKTGLDALLLELGDFELALGENSGGYGFSVNEVHRERLEGEDGLGQIFFEFEANVFEFLLIDSARDRHGVIDGEMDAGKRFGDFEAVPCFEFP